MAYGARPLARLVQEKIKKPLADHLLFGDLEQGGVVEVTVVHEELAVIVASPRPQQSDGKSAKKTNSKINSDPLNFLKSINDHSISWSVLLLMIVCAFSVTLLIYYFFTKILKDPDFSRVHRILKRDIYNRYFSKEKDDAVQ